MKWLWRFVFEENEKAKAPVEEKRSLGAVLLDKLLSLLLSAIESKWEEDLWKPDF